MVERIDELIERLIKHFEIEWGGEFHPNDVVKINDYVRDEVDFDELEWPLSKGDFFSIAMLFELKYG